LYLSLFTKVIFIFLYLLEHDDLKDEIVDTEDKKMIEEFESRILKTGTDEERKYTDNKNPYAYEEEEDEEEENQETEKTEKTQETELAYLGHSYEEHKNYIEPKYYNTYEESASGKDSDYDDVLNQTYQKAKKYKRKAKKLYSNLQRLKTHYERAKQKIAEMEFENHDLNDKLMMFSDRVDELQCAYDQL
jgi:hypothetical protein